MLTRGAGMRHDDWEFSDSTVDPKVVMHPLFFRFPLLLALVALTTALHGHAGTAVSAADEKNVRAVVQAQLEAFAADNARQAFALAAPGLQTQIGTPENFMAMVRSSYPVVYAPASVVFLKPESQDADVIQRVQMTDSRGKPWLAIYSMQRQKDKSWRISGCVVVESRGRFV